MRVSVQWLRDYVRFSWTPMILADHLTAAGLEVESVSPVTLGFEKVRVGKVIALEPHPEAGHLKLCRVSLGDGVVSLICGAPNIRVGLKAALALPGTKLPSGVEVQEKMLRGIPSKGMLCSESELGLGQDTSGIMVLSPHAKLGASLEEVLGGSDTALEVKVTPNRPDCLSMIGIAREVAAILGEKVKIPKAPLVEKGDSVKKIAWLRVQSSKDCPRYIGRIISKIAIQPSPLWMVRRLRAVGQHPINNAVDITNYVLWETGQPLHAFDFERLKGRRVEVRRARAGEKLTTLDGVERLLDPETLVIADGKAPVALAGIMGGLESEVSDQTKQIFLESAWFHPGLIRRGAKRLALRTEASYRFERGTDPEAVAFASQRAAQMLVEFAGGTLARGCLDHYPKPPKPLTLKLRPSRVETILGEAFSAVRIRRTLGRLGLDSKETKGSLNVRIPSYRLDLTREIDIIEEIARGFGYPRFKGKFTTRGGYSGTILPEERVENELRSKLAGFGFVEVMAPSLTRKAALEGAFLDAGAVPLRNPLSDDMAFLRPSLLPGMLEIIARNFGYGARTLRLFEIGKIFHRGDGGPAMEQKALGIALTGDVRPPQFGDPPRPVDLFDLKGVLEGTLASFGIPKVEITPGESWPFLDLGGGLSSRGFKLGWAGRVKRAVAEHFDLKGDLYVSELEIESLKKSPSPEFGVAPLSKFPAIERDLSIVVSENVPWELVEKTLRETGGGLLESLGLFDVFRHERFGPDRKALGISLRFRAPDRTLSADEVERIQAACLARLSEKFTATLRT